MKHWRKFRLACACGEVLDLEVSKEPEAGNETCRYWGFEMHAGAWKCWKCLSRPTPQGMNYLPRIREISELREETPGERTDPEDFIRSLEGKPPIDREALRKTSFLTPDQAIRFYRRFLIRYKHLLGDPSKLPENIKAILDALEAEGDQGDPWEGLEGPEEGPEDDYPGRGPVFP